MNQVKIMKQYKYHLLMLLGCIVNFLLQFGLFQISHNIQYSLNKACMFTALYCVYWFGYTILLNCIGTFKK